MCNKQFSAEIIDEFELCYIPANSVCRTDLIWGRLGLPIHNNHGKTIAYAGRKLIEETANVHEAYIHKYNDTNLSSAKLKKWENSKWINEPYDKIKNLYNFYKASPYIYQKNYAIIVEGYFDVIMCYQKGLRNVVATCGTNISKQQILLLKSLCDFTYILYDPDDAGQLAALRAQELCNNYNLNNKNILLPNNLDPDEFIVNKNCNKLESILVHYITTNDRTLVLK